jgi:hypothetical protein
MTRNNLRRRIVVDGKQAVHDNNDLFLDWIISNFDMNDAVNRCPGIVPELLKGYNNEWYNEIEELNSQINGELERQTLLDEFWSKGKFTDGYTFDLVMDSVTVYGLRAALKETKGHDEDEIVEILWRYFHDWENGEGFPIETLGDHGDSEIRYCIEVIEYNASGVEENRSLSEHMDFDVDAYEREVRAWEVDRPSLLAVPITCEGLRKQTDFIRVNNSLAVRVILREYSVDEEGDD